MIAEEGMSFQYKLLSFVIHTISAGVVREIYQKKKKKKQKYHRVHLPVRRPIAISIH